ncbi:arylamine N-acetyltransferase family protein [Haloarchaeobius sp. HRN-SO-5]|uniref:arylamine N-acetyltransferase family protein n=1 Tax=Haloarchaeobius sp. HRN-SO-5 TaxID=3446118 RepID=UPI003EBF387B
MNADAYLDRIGLVNLQAADATPDRETLRRVVSAHVTSVPFENLAIVGDPNGTATGDGVSLFLPDLYEKLVEGRRGGFCFEVNGLFDWLLSELGYDVDRCAARVVGDDESIGRPPANHHTNVVHLDRRFLVDVGTGTPQLRTPVPLDGVVVEDAAGVRWRVVPDDGPLSDYTLRLREPGEDWTVRYRFQTTPRKLTFFEATCEFLANQPDGTFTSGPIVKRSTADGSVGLDADALARTVGAETTTTDVAPDEWHAVLAREFGIRL